MGPHWRAPASPTRSRSQNLQPDPMELEVIIVDCWRRITEELRMDIIQGWYIKITVEQEKLQEINVWVKAIPQVQTLVYWPLQVWIGTDPFTMEKQNKSLQNSKPRQNSQIKTWHHSVWVTYTYSLHGTTKNMQWTLFCRLYYIQLYYFVQCPWMEWITFISLGAEQSGHFEKCKAQGCLSWEKAARANILPPVNKSSHKLLTSFRAEGIAGCLPTVLLRCWVIQYIPEQEVGVM